MDLIIATKRVEYARTFMAHFPEQFKDIAANPNHDIELPLSRDDFDKFLVKAELMEYTDENGDVYIMDDVPEKGSTHWATFVGQRNMIRTEMNAASQFGHHGEPPFRIDIVKGGQYVIRSLVSIARVSQADMGASMKSLCTNFQSKNQKMSEFIAERMHEVPAHLQHNLRQHDGMFNITVLNALGMFNTYLAAVEADNKQAYQHLLEQDDKKRLGVID